MVKKTTRGQLVRPNWVYPWSRPSELHDVCRRDGRSDSLPCHRPTNDSLPEVLSRTRSTLLFSLTLTANYVLGRVCDLLGALVLESEAPARATRGNETFETEEFFTVEERESALRGVFWTWSFDRRLRQG